MLVNICSCLAPLLPLCFRADAANEYAAIFVTITTKYVLHLQVFGDTPHCIDARSISSSRISEGYFWMFGLFFSAWDE